MKVNTSGNIRQRRSFCKLRLHDYDRTNRDNAYAHIRDHQRKGQVVTGLLYLSPDSKVRLFSLDSQDGLMGVDFHPGAATTVTETSDWDTGGAAQPTVVVGVTGDATLGDSGLSNVRQSKVASAWRCC